MTATSKHLVSFFVVTLLGSFVLLTFSGLFLDNPEVQNSNEALSQPGEWQEN